MLIQNRIKYSSIENITLDIFKELAEDRETIIIAVQTVNRRFNIMSEIYPYIEALGVKDDNFLSTKNLIRFLFKDKIRTIRIEVAPDFFDSKNIPEQIRGYDIKTLTILAI